MSREVLWVWGQSILMVALLAAGPIGGSWSAASELARITGGVLLGFGAWMGIAGVVGLGSHRTISPRPKPNSALVTHGIYRRVRHPLYGSLIALGVAWSLVWASWVSGALTLLLWRFLFSKSTVEETFLCSLFPEYTAYRARVPRFFPFSLATGGAER